MAKQFTRITSLPFLQLIMPLFSKKYLPCKTFLTVFINSMYKKSLQETIEKEVIDGVVPFFREKPKDVALIEGEPLQLACLVASEPKAAIHWLKNDLIFMEDSRYVSFLTKVQNHVKSERKLCYFCFIHPIFSSLGFWYFGHLSCVIFFTFFFSVLAILSFKM